MTTGGKEGAGPPERSEPVPDRTAPASSPGPPPLRIGTAERESAAKALDAHLEAGRLGVEEYADRSAAAAVATVASELQALFVDLPEPHPTLPGTAVTPVAPAASVPAPTGAQPPAERSPLSSWGPRIVAITPIVALALFLALNGVFAQAWIFFLLIPAVGGLVYGRERGDDRDRDREQRRLLRDDRRRLDRGDGDRP